MAFVYDALHSSMVKDPESGIYVEEYRGMTDDHPDLSSYTYVDHEFSFHFTVLEIYEVRYNERHQVGGKIDWHKTQPWVTQAWQRSKREPLTLSDLYKIQKSIQDAVFLLLSAGGARLKFVPNFKIEIVNAEILMQK